MKHEVVWTPGTNRRIEKCTCGWQPRGAISPELQFFQHVADVTPPAEDPRPEPGRKLVDLEQLPPALRGYLDSRVRRRAQMLAHVSLEMVLGDQVLENPMAHSWSEAILVLCEAIKHIAEKSGPPDSRQREDAMEMARRLITNVKW